MCDECELPSARRRHYSLARRLDLDHDDEASNFDRQINHNIITVCDHEDHSISIHGSTMPCSSILQ
jgi:hypothetical protein